MGYDPYNSADKQRLANTHHLGRQFGSAVPYQTENRAMREPRSERTANMLLAETIKNSR